MPKLKYYLRSNIPSNCISSTLVLALLIIKIIKESNGKTNETTSIPEFPIGQENSSFSYTGDITILTKYELKFAVDGLNSHNRFRELHDVPRLALDAQLCLDSLKWAKKVAEESDSTGELTLKHSKLPDRGENIYACRGPDHWNRWMGTNSTHSRANEAVAAWYSEINNYNFSNPRYHWKSGHFTQLIWKESTSMGMAWAVGPHGTIAVVAQYRPFGNVVNIPGEFEKNVLPLSAAKAPKKKLKMNPFMSVLKKASNSSGSGSLKRIHFVEEVMFD